MAEGPYLLGIDFGTGGARVGIFDPEGTPLVFSEREYTLKHPRPGWAEQDPDEWWSCLVAAVKGAIEESRISPEDIAGISIDAMSSTVLAIEKIEPTGWSLVQDHLRGWTNSPAELRAGDKESTERLVEGLILSGLGMQSYQSSRTASGAEHQFSHLWEMEGLGHGEGHEGTPLSHGFKVGVGTVAIAALYELVLERDLGGLDVESLCDSWPTREAMERSVLAQHSNPDLERGAVEQTVAKYISAGELARRLELLRDVWPGLRKKVRVQLMPAEQTREMLQAAGCPTGPVEIGLRWEDFGATYSRARTIRKRYTVLDLAFEAGILEECVDELFAPDGFWGRTAASQTRADGTQLVDSFRSDVREKHDDR